MLKKILLSLAFTLLLAAAAVGCSKSENLSEQGYTSNCCYIIKEADYSDFQKFVPSNSTVTEEEKNEYRIPNTESLTAGETYYVIGYTEAKTKDGSVIQFWDDCGFTLKTNIPVIDAFEVVDSGATVCDGGSTVEVTRSEEKESNEKMMFLNVFPTAVSGKAEFISYVKIKVKAEMRLNVDYQVIGSRYHSYGKNPYFDRANSVSEAYANAYYAKQIGISGIEVKYLESKDFINGRYDDSALVDSVDMKVGKAYYMVLTTWITSYITESSGEMFNVNLKLPFEFVDGTLEEAGSGSFSESKTDTDKNISVSFKIPEASEGQKKITCIVKLIPVALQTPEINIVPSADMISILGNGSSGVKCSLKINGEEKTSEGFEYILSEDKTYYILQSVGMADGSSFLVPATYDEKPVKKISDGAFKDLKAMRTVEISEGIEEIGEGVFRGCENLISAKLPGSATVGGYTFAGCNALSSLTVNLEGIQLKTLFGDSEDSIPSSLKAVAVVGSEQLVASAFAGASTIEAVSLPASLTSIGDGAFTGCASLKFITVAEGNTTFYSKNGSVYYTSTDEVLIEPEGK